MRNTLRKTMIAGMKKAAITEVSAEIASVYSHEKWDKKQILSVVLSAVMVDNKDVKAFVEDTLKDSGMTIRWGRIIRDGGCFLVEATIRVPAHFYSDKKLSKREWKREDRKTTNESED